MPLYTLLFQANCLGPVFRPLQFLPILHKKCTKTEHEPLKWQVPQAHDAPQYEGVATALVHEKNKLRYLHKAAFSHDDMYISPLKKCAVLNEDGDKTTETKAFCVTGVIFHCMKEQLVRSGLEPVTPKHTRRILSSHEHGIICHPALKVLLNFNSTSLS